MPAAWSWNQQHFVKDPLNPVDETERAERRFESLWPERVG
jgi:hypothetical protein